MNIRWRLGVGALQFVIIAAVTYKITGKPVVGELWFLGGLILLTIHPVLFEPYYATPRDVAGNSAVCLLLYFVVPKSITSTGWDILGFAAGVALVLAVLALAGGAGRKGDTTIVRLARSARAVSAQATARRFYSAIFLLALFEQRAALGETHFWWLVGVWLAVLVVGQVNWQTVWSTVSGAPAPCQAEGMVGPSRLLIVAPDVPEPGSWVSLKAGLKKAQAVVITRIRRSGDVWGQVHVSDPTMCEELLEASALTMLPVNQPVSDVVGAVDVGSTDTSLRFVATRQLETGQVVAIREKNLEILYQLSGARIEQSTVAGGSHLVVRVEAVQLGHFDPAALRLKQHRWVPPIGAAVIGTIAEPVFDSESKPDKSIRLGRVIGTEVPIFLDLKEACEGHLVILGMTKMGKTSLAVRLANELSCDQPVVILDQSREYVDRRGLPRYEKDQVGDVTGPGMWVLEPPQNFKDHPAALAYKFLEKLVALATQEYVDGEIVPRTLMLDEAHQFIPEPAGMGFKAPGRQYSMRFGLLMMQVRKYGISMVIVSQRTAVVSKSALSQWENIIAFRYVDQTGLDYLETVAGSDARKLVPKLEQGQALVFGPAMSSAGPVAIDVDWEPLEKPETADLDPTSS